MCTAISYLGKQGHYFGRNLDLSYSYQEQVVITPRYYPFSFRNGNALNQHLAMIGMATIADEYPLYYEATNEHGLSMAGLNFPDNAAYLPKIAGKENIAPFELIPWVLGQCSCLTEAKALLQNCNVWKLPFSQEYALTPLHWLISDNEGSITVEPMSDGLRIYDNPIGVLVNNPPFPYQLYHLADYRNLSPRDDNPSFGSLKIKPYSSAMGAIGLPGDFSSASRFVRAAFVKEYSAPAEDDVSHYFHLLNSVAIPRGSVLSENGMDHITIYSSCCDTGAGIYYYTTYENSRITAIRMDLGLLDRQQLTVFPLRTKQDIYFEN